MARKRIPTLSLFSGAGGLDLGFLQAGFDIKACVEIEEAYCATLRENTHGGSGYNADVAIHQQDIKHFKPALYKDMGIRCVIGGPPCQTFSAAGRRAGGVIGTEDERGSLFRHYCRILKELQPEVFVFENVYGLPGANGGAPWREIVNAFSALGYQLCAEVVDAADYGVPQHRERLIMVGSRSGTFTFPMPTHGPDSQGGPALVSVKDAIADLQDPEEPYHDTLGGMYGHLLPLVPEGLNYSYFTAEMGHPEPVFAWRSKFHDLLYKVAQNEPCRTLKAQPGKFTGPFHWKNRHFTVAELRRLQTFPDDFQLVGSYAKVIEQIGNSVPPRLAYVMACAVRDQLLEARSDQEFRVRPVGFKSTFRKRQRERSKRFEDIAQAAIKKCYGAQPGKPALLTPAASTEVFFLSPKSLFDHRRLARRPSRREGTAVYQVEVRERGPHIEIRFDKADALRGEGALEISGLCKYLPNFDTLSLKGRIDAPEDVFHAWQVIERALVQRSRFFTLIDIYGHYANRGDTVKVAGEWSLGASAPFLKTLNLFSSSDSCGEFLSEDSLRWELGVEKHVLPELVASLRAIRFDFRTAETHPIIGKRRVICTYPFPLLSPRALVESRTRLVREEERSANPVKVS